MKKSIFSFVLLSLISASASAGWYNQKNVKYIASSVDGRITFNTSQALSNPANCPAPDVYIIPKESNAEHALAILLTAKSSNQIIRVNVDTIECINNRPVVRTVAIGHPY